jgi:DNA sulfur modification protein DndD
MGCRMRISLAGWASSGLRCPDVEISLNGESDAPAQVSLIQMPNGTGKTTTLEMLRATLTGGATEWTPDQVASFRRSDETNATGSFRVALLVDGRPLTIELILDFDERSARYRTTSPGSGGVQPRWAPPPALRRFLTPAFLDLFIFDGEFADELLAQNAGRADEAIDALCQLYLVDQIKQVAENQWQRRTSQGGPKTQAGLVRYQQQRAVLLDRKAVVEMARKRAQQKLDEDSVLIDELAAKIQERLSSVEATKQQHTEAQIELQSATAAVAAASGDVMRLIRMPLALHPRFSAGLMELKENLDHLKLPENSSAQFFADLVEEPDCICGRPMTEAAKSEILTRARGYLDAEDAGTINALKHDIDRFVTRPGETSLYEQLEEASARLGEARRQQRAANQVLGGLAKRLIDEGDDQLEAWQSTLEAKKAELAECSSILRDIDGPGEDEDEVDRIMSMKLIDKKLNDVGQKIAEITQTVSLKQQTDLLNAILDRAAERARQTIREELVEESNKRLESVLVNDPLRIARIDKSLHLHQGGASVGQKLSIGYVFLMSALSRGNNDFPLVVDSPANPIDEGVRRNIGRLIPELCTQFVGFTINTERPGFVPALERASGDCLFLTLFRRTEGTRRLTRNLPAAGVTETANAYLVRDRGYFMTFDVTEEEDA